MHKMKQVVLALFRIFLEGIVSNATASVDTSILDNKRAVQTHLRWIETPRNDGGLGGLNYPLVSDLSREIATKYDVLLDGGVALRGSFIIDPNGTLRQATINDLPVGRNVDEAIRLIKAFQYTEEHGEVCPAGWDEGSDTIKPDVQGSKEYFSKQG